MELREFSTFTKQGNVGLAYAIAYYSKLGYTTARNISIFTNNWKRKTI